MAHQNVSQFCENRGKFESLIFSIIGTYVFIIICQIVALVILCDRRKSVKKQFNRYSKNAGQEFQCFVSAYIFLMKKEGYLKIENSVKFTNSEAKRAMTDIQCRNKIGEMKEQIIKYFTLNDIIIEGPYYGFGAKNIKNFANEEQKHRRGENTDVPESEEGSGRYESLRVMKKVAQAVKAEKHKIRQGKGSHGSVAKGSHISSFGGHSQSQMSYTSRSPTKVDSLFADKTGRKG